MKKALKIALFSVLGLVVVAGVLVWMEFGSLLTSSMRHPVLLYPQI